uniref:ETS domain-containing protein n=1 Tax=Ciona intestinalis TaxID=7719 RepID=F6QIY7_CIOIN
LHARLEIWRSAYTAVGSQLLQSNEYQEIEENMGVPPPAAETGLFSLKPKHLNCQSNYSTEVITDNKMMISTAIHTRSKLEDTNSSAAALTPNYSSGIHLWQFLKELLLQPQSFSRYIRWIDKQRGIFKIEDSVEVARLWGVRKNRPAMNYDKLSRSIRQ